jgi:muconolactone delta-isomerase
VEVLVRIEAHLPPDMDEDARRRLLEHERQEGEALVEEGILYAIWRLPGSLANVGIWRVEDADHLAAVLIRLPIVAYANVRAELPATHPLRTPGVPSAA